MGHSEARPTSDSSEERKLAMTTGYESAAPKDSVTEAKRRRYQRQLKR